MIARVHLAVMRPLLGMLDNVRNMDSLLRRLNTVTGVIQCTVLLSEFGRIRKTIGPNARTGYLWTSLCRRSVTSMMSALIEHEGLRCPRVGVREACKK